MHVYIARFSVKLINNLIEKLKSVGFTDLQTQSFSETFREISVGIFVALIIVTVLEKEPITINHVFAFVLGIIIWYINFVIQRILSKSC
ncbi:MAG: hypothetical protein XD95_0223 [Microgenomates bacterium 39_7]|nr:MAG: hypothetical protein XD95_0223 [Microgenomates bacterium 39_7]